MLRYDIGDQFGQILSMEEISLEYSEANERLLQFLQTRGAIAGFNRQEDNCW